MTQISITSVTCAVNVTASSCRVTISGGLPGDHNNALGQITVATTGQTVTTTGSTDGAGGTCASLPNDGSVTFLGVSPSPNVIYRESPAQTSPGGLIAVGETRSPPRRTTVRRGVSAGLG